MDLRVSRVTCPSQLSRASHLNLEFGVTWQVPRHLLEKEALWAGVGDKRAQDGEAFRRAACRGPSTSLSCLRLHVTHLRLEHGPCPLLDIWETEQKHKLKNPTRRPNALASQEQCWVPEDAGPRLLRNPEFSKAGATGIWGGTIP